jgi:hypothetical protein
VVVGAESTSGESAHDRTSGAGAPDRLAADADAGHRTLTQQIAVSSAENVGAESRGMDLLAVCSPPTGCCP